MTDVVVTQVVGYEATNNRPTRVVVHGLTQSSTSFEVVLQLQSRQIHATASLTASTWSAEFRVGNQYQDGDITCGQVVGVSIPDREYAKTDFRVRCYDTPTCPAWKSIAPGDVQVGHCDNGVRRVTITLRIEPRNQPTYATLYAYNLATGTPSSADVSWSPNESTTSGTLVLSPGTYIAQARTDDPCFGSAIRVIVPECGCPSINFGDVSATGTTVSASATVVVGSDVPVDARLVLVTDLQSLDNPVRELARATDQNADFSLSGSASGIPAGDYHVAVAIDRPSGCGSSSSLVTVSSTVPATRCPSIDLSNPQVGDCSGGTRSVTAHATVTVPTGTTGVGATLRITGGTNTVVLDRKQTQSGSFTLDGTAAMPPGTYTLEVVIDAPSGCPGATKSVTVGPCADGGEPHNGDGGRFQIPWCEMLAVAAIFLTAFGLAMMGFFFCVLCWSDVIVEVLVALGAVSAGSTATVALVLVIILIVLIFVGEAMAIAGNLLYLLWLLTCGSCRRNCRLINNVLWVLAILDAIWWFIALLGTIGGRPCSIGWAIGGIDIGWLILITLYYGAMVGCFEWPDFVPRFLRFRVPLVVRILCGDK